MHEINTSPLDDSLTHWWNNPEQLPDSAQWLQEPRSEAARAQYAFLLLKRQFARAGMSLKREEVPTSWTGWSWLFYLNIDDFVTHGARASMLRGLLSRVVDYTEAFSGEFFAPNLLEMIEPFIDRDPPRTKFLPLLPMNALEKMDEMEQILTERHDAELERMGTMSY